MASDLLPPNASALERALAKTATRLDVLEVPASELWNPATCPITILPWLAWSLSIDNWNADWTDDQKRTATANAIAMQRKKGSVAAVKDAMSAIDSLLTLVEWHQASPRLSPHTFQVHLPVIDATGTIGGARCSAATTAQIIADISRVKPARSHFDVILDLTVGSLARLHAAARSTMYRRFGFDADDASINWFDLLADENGEPLTDDSGAYFEGASS